MWKAVALRSPPNPILVLNPPIAHEIPQTTFSQPEQNNSRATQKFLKRNPALLSAELTPICRKHRARV